MDTEFGPMKPSEPPPDKAPPLSPLPASSPLPLASGPLFPQGQPSSNDDEDA
jgi:hypothetical protein